ncbi:MAG: hypothetical protein UR66_C0006G0079 [Candidatus Moranbacteria bacterium GW2011_GWE1_35_17]|nr:MAG: hypothetical protein UR66_C0006G0079 [Candidatus Moranbacteria bacterium GW2011_GWE1_35_17]KKP72319.1 MAG: hypothetical protein UR65_C0017G0005 [Candidatus Moranbacteria bacterium GW2011_GWE2_35_164]KKP80504.1 MAG: hypothetical protein UR82_C0092G0003 [Candidatus Moranbacteria bacterium GW2011_GWF1_35_5]KKP84100.1 MAG: hypothetical protein UR83_C0027G0007 [Candidatus Moranbacteria bacterium GW2011_GWF2_35_54]
MKKPVLFLTFNRLDTTQRVFEEIKKAKPPRLYLASDGAREDKEGEKEIVQKTRDFILNNINWDCEVETLFRDKNLGCGRAVSEAITWFFENEKDGIILEDDCLPHPSFFNFCEELLDYYKDNKKVWHISGDQFMPNYSNGASYYFAKIMHCWGWAGWADRWKEYQFDLKKYDKTNVNRFSDDKNVREYWKAVLERVKGGEVNTWDYQWTFKIIEKNGLCINPSKNLVSNIGIIGTHYSDASIDPNLNMPIFEIDKIIHPEKIEVDIGAVDYIFKYHFNINFYNKLEDTCNNKVILNKNKLMMSLKKIKGVLMTILVKFFKKNNINVSEEYLLFEKYRNKERFIEEEIIFKGRKLRIPDVVSFAYQIKEIFSDEIYKFQSGTESPVIYDCGANVGTSVLYFKKLFPKSKIKAFEADEKIYKILKENVGDLNDVELIHKAVWVNDENLTFNSEGADGGSLVGNFNDKQTVKALRLKDLLENEEVIDFLKMDIEGAESEVIRDCANSLKNVKNIFVEYHSFKNQKQDLDEILIVLRKNGFRYFLETINKPTNPFIQTENDNPMDLQVNIFGVKN